MSLDAELAPRMTCRDEAKLGGPFKNIVEIKFAFENRNALMSMQFDHVWVRLNKT